MSAEYLRETARMIRQDYSDHTEAQFENAVADLLDLCAGHEERAGDECGQGWRRDHSYGYIDPSCSTCGTPDEYAEPWPCAYVSHALAVARAWRGDA